MATEVEYVNYKDFVADLESTENPGVDDVTVVSNGTDGPRTIPANTSALTNTATDSDLTDAASFELQTANGKKKVPANLLSKQSGLETTNGTVAALTTYAQNVAHSIAPEFDPTRTSENPYKAGETVVYTDGKRYIFNVDHYGPWNASDVSLLPISSCVDVDRTTDYLYNDDYEPELNITDKYVKGADGLERANPLTDWICSDFIKVPSLKLHYNGYCGFDAACIAYYDQGKNFISAQGYQTGTAQVYDFDLVVPRNAVYFRASAYIGTAYTGSGIPCHITAKSALPSIRNDINSLNEDVFGEFETFNHAGYLKADGTWSANSYVSVNASVKVKEGDKFAYEGVFGYSACAFITKNNGTIVQHYGDSAGQSVPAVFVVPSGVDEIVFSSYIGVGSTPVMSIKKLNSVYEICQQFNDRLSGKRIVFDGDSICAGNTGIPLDDPRRGWGWAHRIGAAHNMDWHNVSVSGGTVCSDTYYFTAITGSPDWSNTYYVKNANPTSSVDLYVQVTESTWDGESALYTKGSARHWESTFIETIYSNYPSLDYIIFENCLNDMFNGVPMGELAGGYTGTFATTKFIPALEHLFQRAITLYPQAKLGMIIPHMTGWESRQKPWVEAAISVCKKWAIPYINLYEKSGLVYPMTSQQGVLYADSAHLLSAGYDFITPKIESWIASL